MVGHRLLGNTLLVMGDATDARSHLDRALALYDPAVHRPLATRFGHDVGTATLAFRPLALWLLGYPETALVETDRAINAARETDHLPTLLMALSGTLITHICCRDHVAATAHAEECFNLAQEKKVPFMIGFAAALRGCVLAQTGKASDAIQTISAWITGMRAMGATVWGTSFLSHLALAYAELGQFDDAGRYIDDAISTIETTKERWFEAETNRIAGEIALKSPLDAMKAEAYFERALAVARQQQAKSWELRAAMSMARLWRDQGNPQQARELLAPVYSRFTEGFDTLDLKEAKALLGELHG